MRITTQMMQASAKRAGISLGGTSLLNYINNGSTQSTQGALLNELNTKQHSAVSKTQSAGYEKLEKNADALSESLKTFLAEGEESIFQKAEDDKQLLADAVERMVEDYNATVKSLKNTSNPLNDFYKEMMQEAGVESETDLATIGIMQKEDGTFALDEEKLKNAGTDTIKKALDGNGTFTSKIAFIASRISDNAKANMESYSSQYGADGYSYVANSSRYDFWG